MTAPIKINISDKRFLVVDDFGDMRSMLRSMLNLFGVQYVDSASNGNDAIEMMALSHYDVVLCDYNLGSGKDGQQVLEEARKRELLGVDSLFVMVTAESTRRMVMGAVEYEPDAYLTKPFTKDLLRSRLLRLLARKLDLVSVERAVRKRDYDRAIALLKKKIAERPSNMAELQRQEGELCLKARRYEEAGSVYQQVLEDRDIPWARLGLGRVMYNRGDYAYAVTHLEKLAGESEGFPAVYDWLARSYLGVRRAEEAQQVLQKAVELSPRAILRQKELGEIAMRNGDNEAASQAFEQAVRLANNSVYKEPSIFANRALMRARTGRPSKARKLLNEMQREFPNDPAAEVYRKMSQGRIEADAGNSEQARACFAEALEGHRALSLDSTPEMTLELARCASELGQTEQAEALLARVVRDNHGDPRLLADVGLAIEQSGLAINPEEFIASARHEVVELNNTGVKLAQSGKLDEAVQLFREAAEKMPANRVVSLNAVRILVMQMQKQGKSDALVEEARGYLKRVERVDPDSPELNKVRKSFLNLVNGG